MSRCSFSRAMLALVTSLTIIGAAVAVPVRAAATAPTVPAGFVSAFFAGGLYRPTAMSIGPDKRLYVAQQNGLVRVVSKHGLVSIGSGFATPLGLAWHNRILYVSSTGLITTLTPNSTFTTFTAKTIVSGIPTGEHQNDGLAFHGGWMYMGVGSTCNACAESDSRSATIMRFHLDGTHAQVYAHGLRNPYGLAFQPSTGVLYSTENGRDDHGDSVPDEFNRTVKGEKYGWPDCWGTGQGSHCAGTVAPAVDLPAHASADGLTFYNGTTFPARYRGDAFIAEWGDDADTLGTGHVVQDVHFGSGKPALSTFASGLQHPLAVTISPNGSLLIADWGTGIIWRVRAA